MGRRLTMEPSGWPCPLSECPPGPFVWIGEPCADLMGWMSEYGDNDGSRTAFNGAGECIAYSRWKDCLVQPLTPTWWSGSDDDGWEVSP